MTGFPKASSHQSTAGPPNSSPYRIMVVEECEDLATGIVQTLQLEGFIADSAADAEAAFRLARDLRPHLFLLDLVLPGMDGFEFIRAWRGRGNTEPIIVLTARDQQLDKLRCFSLGADDYVTKPFDVLELLARMRAVLNRTDSASEAAVLQFDRLQIDPGARIVRREGEPVDLSPLEFDLLWVLVKRAGNAVSREQLLKEIWHHKGKSKTRTVDSHIYSLRQKLESDPAMPKYILSVRKVGYRFDP